MKLSPLEVDRYLYKNERDRNKIKPEFPAPLEVDRYLYAAIFMLVSAGFVSVSGPYRGR